MSLESLAESAQFLVGKTIASVGAAGCHERRLATNEQCDGENILTFIFTDGTKAEISGGYGGYTGKSCDEYFEMVNVYEVKP